MLLTKEAVNKAEGIIPSCQFCCGVVALEEQSLSCYNPNSFSHQRSWVLSPFPSSRLFLPAIYPVWSPAKFFSSGSLWPVRQGIQITHIRKSHPCFPWECIAYKYLVLKGSHFSFACPSTELPGKIVCKFAVWFCSCLPQGFLSYWKLWTPLCSPQTQENPRKINPLHGKALPGPFKLHEVGVQYHPAVGAE